jgi:hypothetical protein
LLTWLRAFSAVSALYADGSMESTMVRTPELRRRRCSPRYSDAERKHASRRRLPVHGFLPEFLIISVLLWADYTPIRCGWHVFS